MKLLVLGGTRFLGRHVVEQALAAGHDVTLLHRGRSGSGLFPQAEHRIGDRNGDLSILADGHWDAVIDTSAYVPRQVRAVAQALAGRVGHYHLVSTISVYRDIGEGQGPVDESAPLASLDDPSTETVDGRTYGGLKVLCEQAAEAGFGPRLMVSRPGLLVGPHDPTERFTWWVRRVRQGGRFVAPGPADAPLQFIDARDAAAWMLRQAETGATGVANLTGPVGPITMGGFVQALCSALAPAAQPVWFEPQRLLDAGVAPWMGLPLWIPGADGRLHQTDIARAMALGLHCRPLADTLRDTAAWADAAPPPQAAATGLTGEQEAVLLGR